jgi:putative oxidoreductase
MDKLNPYFGLVGRVLQSIMFMKNLAVAGGFLMLAAYGPGALALDNRSKGRGAATSTA